MQGVKVHKTIIYFRGLVVFILCLALWACQCEGGDGEPGVEDGLGTPGAVIPGAGSVPIEASVTEGQWQAIEALKARMTRGDFDWADRSDRKNAHLFVALAASGEGPELLAAALQAMDTGWTHAEGGAREPVNEDYRRVVRARLRHDDRRVVGMAMHAAGHALMTPAGDRPIEAALVEIFSRSDDPAARYGALQALSQGGHQSEAFQGVLRLALSDDSPFVVSAALRFLGFVAYAMEAVGIDLTGLFGHEDPGVRGRAMTLAPVLMGRSDARAALFRGLSDAHPYVRSASAAALGALGEKSAIHRLMALTGDEMEDTYTLRGLVSLTGSALTLVHKGSSRVDRSAIKAIEVLSRDMGLDAFKVRGEGAVDKSEDVSRASLEVRRWYARVKDGLPSDG